MDNEYEIKKQICDIGKRIYDRGMVAANDGNISVKLNGNEFLCTPTGVSKGFMTSEYICKVDAEGNVIQANGNFKPSSEIKMHMRVYKHRPDVNSVVHAHPSYATAFAIAGIPLTAPIMPEAVISLGCVPIAEYGTPSTNEIPDAVEKYLPYYDAVLLENHGALSFSVDLSAAYYKMESLEFYAELLYKAKQLGGPKELSNDQVQKLYEIRSQFGLPGKHPADLCAELGSNSGGGCQEMMGNESTTKAFVKAGAIEIPKTARAAMLTSLEHFDIKEYPIPEIRDDDILVKVEGCGVCGTDAHEFKRDPFNLIPVVLGHEGTGEIVKMGKNVKLDSAGKPLNIGDKVVTCMIFKDNPDITMFDLNKQNVGGADVYGLLPDDGIHFNGWFSDYIVIRGGSTIFNVSDLDLDSRILIEPCAVLIHAVERAKTTGILRFNSRVVVQGCGPIGLICIAMLRTMGIQNIVAVDGKQKRLEFAKELGTTAVVNFNDHKGIEELTEAVKKAFGGYLADFAFQCTGSPVAHANIYKFIRNGGGLCELGFFINGGDATINPHFDICAKEITTVGSWVYTLRDYGTAFDFLKSAKQIGLPIHKLITHKFLLDQINEAHVTNLKMEGLKIAIVNE